MKRMQPTRTMTLGVTFGALGLAGGLLGRTYRREIAAIQRRLKNESQVVQTEVGPIEYACRFPGPGQPYLAVHGAGGGYDQGLVISELLGEQFPALIVSRFGYLRTPLPSETGPASAAAQAHAHRALLDALDIPRVIIIGASAGGPSAILFAQLYPKRCAGLVLLSAVSRPLTVDYPALPLLLRLGFRSDLLAWLLIEGARPFLPAILGLSRSKWRQLSPDERAWLIDYRSRLMPLSQRKTGILNDLVMLARLPRLPLDQVRVPTLVIHAADDPTVPVDYAYFSARNIPRAQLLILPDGGHLLLGRHEEARAAVSTFLLRHSTVTNPVPGTS